MARQRTGEFLFPENIRLHNAPGLQPLVNILNKLFHILNNTTIVSGGDIQVTQDAIIMRCKGGSSSVAKMFSVTSTSGTTVSLKGGVVLFGDSTPISVADGSVTVSGGTAEQPQIVHLKVGFDRNAEFTVDNEFRGGESDAFYIPLHTFATITGSLSHQLRCHEGPVILPGVFA